jgi:casein kinase 1
MELTVGKIFKLTRKLGQGAFGEIYHAINTKHDSEVAVKLEPAKTSHPQLFYEAKLLAYLNNNDSSLDLGIPQVV